MTPAVGFVIEEYERSVKEGGGASPPSAEFAGLSLTHLKLSVGR